MSLSSALASYLSETSWLPCTFTALDAVPQSMSVEPTTHRRTLDNVYSSIPRLSSRFFYISSLNIDDPLSPVPSHAPSTTDTKTYSPRPFSDRDNVKLENTWNGLREDASRCHSENEEQQNVQSVGKRSTDSVTWKSSTSVLKSCSELSHSHEAGNPQSDDARGIEDPTGFRHSLQAAPTVEVDTVDIGTSGTPFLRAPPRSEAQMQLQDAKTQNVANDAKLERVNTTERLEEVDRQSMSHRSAGILVGIQRLHQINLPDLKMVPIYWKPVHDIVPVMRATWFFEDTMLPVEVDVANQLECGFLTLQPWTQTWRDELGSAVATGAAGEVKISHRLWPEHHERKTGNYSGSTLDGHGEEGATTPEQARQRSCVDTQTFLRDNDFGDNIDHAASGDSCYSRVGPFKMYPDAAVIYADEIHAYLLRPNLQPSAYYGRRPLANYIRKGHALGICVRRGFCELRWNQLYPAKRDKNSISHQAVRTQYTTSAEHQAKSALNSAMDSSEFAASPVKHLILVIHGIGQKLSERVESYHFTHVTNSLRRLIDVELATSNSKVHINDRGGVMILPCNWRSSLDFDLTDPPNSVEPLRDQQYSLDDITPDSLPSIRSIISDVMLDIPYYLSHHQSTMINAVVREANRIFYLWCKNNPGFKENGSVHLLCHSLGSVMAIDVLSKQPTRVTEHVDGALVLSDEHFAFNTKNLFLCGSPAGFFLLLKKAELMPRQDSVKDDGIDATTGKAGQYGCIAVENIYNIINPYDPVAFRLNPTVDTAYAASLKKAYLPSATKSWFSFTNPFKSSDAPPPSTEPKSTSMAIGLPQHVELERHNFLQEAMAEKRMYLLNDNGQIDYYMRYGGGPLEIQYLTMLGAHSSYWLSRDFVHFICVETVRERGRKGTLQAMRAIKKNTPAMS